MDGKKKDFNIGLAFIRIWMSFEVVLCHFWKQGKPELGDPLWIFSRMAQMAVPVFMLISFILTEKNRRLFQDITGCSYLILPGRLFAGRCMRLWKNGFPLTSSMGWKTLDGSCYWGAAGM